MTEENVKKVRITEFKKGETPFRSTGISNVKVTQEDVVCCLEIPIQSTGISELIDTFSENAPQPPARNTLVKKDDEIGKQLGLKKDDWIKIPDVTDPKYIKEKEEFDSNLGIAIVCKGLAIDIKAEDGSIVTEKDKKVDILKGMGLSGDQFSQIVTDITSLTRWTQEETRDFFATKLG